MKSINPSLLHSNHFNFKEGRSSSTFRDYFQFSVYPKLCIPSVKLFQIFLFWLICIKHKSVLEDLSVCLTEAYNFPASAGGFWIDPFRGNGTITIALVQSHAPCQNTSQTPELPQQLQHLEHWNLGSISLM